MGFKMHMLRVCIYIIIILCTSTLKVSMRSNRNTFLTCQNDDSKSCNECDQNNNYKKCENNMCYCCDFIQSKCVYQNKNSNSS